MAAMDVAFVLLMVLLVGVATSAVTARGMLASVVSLSVVSVAAAVAFAFLGAVDVAMAEAVIGAGLMTALFVAALGRIGGMV